MVFVIPWRPGASLPLLQVRTLDCWWLASVSSVSCHSAGCQRARLTCPQNLFPAGSHPSRCPGSPHSSCPHPGSGTGSVTRDNTTDSAVTHSGVLATPHRQAVSAPHRSMAVRCYLEPQNPQCPLSTPGCLLLTHTEPSQAPRPCSFWVSVTQREGSLWAAGFGKSSVPSQGITPRWTTPVTGQWEHCSWRTLSWQGNCTTWGGRSGFS